MIEKERGIPMSLYKRSTFGSRFLAFFIDYIILGIFQSLFGVILLGKKYFQMYSGGLNQANNLFPTYKYVLYYGVSFGIFLIYFVIIPLVWEKQTVGRYASGVKVLKKDGNEPTAGTLIMREFIGHTVDYVTWFICCIGLIIDIVFLNRDEPTTISEEIASTQLVYTNQINNNNKYNKERPYVDAKDNSETIDDENMFDYFNKDNPSNKD